MAADDLDDVIYIDVSPEKQPKCPVNELDESGIDVIDLSDDEEDDDPLDDIPSDDLDQILEISLVDVEEQDEDQESKENITISDCYVQVSKCKVPGSEESDDVPEEEETKDEGYKSPSVDASRDEGYDSPASVRRSGRWKERQKNQEKENLSEYEKIREENIKERMELLKKLNLQAGFSELLNDSYKDSRKKNRKRASTEQPLGERRKSARLASKEEEDSEYIPDYREEKSDDRYALDDPADHTHEGIRKHPCRECSNCVKPDCRRCVFCRDKKIYGGKNIKKQKCMYKDKCSNPVVICNICNGSRSFSCNVCGEKFPESYLLNQHRESSHKIEQVRRRSSRISQQNSRVVYGEADDEGS